MQCQKPFSDFMTPGQQVIEGFVMTPEINLASSSLRILWIGP